MGGDYRIVQITFDGVDHRWPSINNNGDVVWSQQVAGKWQVFRKNAPASSSAGGAQLQPAPADAPNHNYKYPAISDGGDIVYLRDNNPRNNGSSDLQVIRRSSTGAEAILEFSSRNVDLINAIGAQRDAGRHFGIASDGKTISYYDFSRTGSATVRRFNVPGFQFKDSIGAIRSFVGSDYPSINADGYYVYAGGPGVFKSSLSGTDAFRVDLDGEQGTAPSIGDGIGSTVTYIRSPLFQNGDVISGEIKSRKGTNQPVSVHSGSWAYVNKSGLIVFEDLINGNRQLFLAYPLVHFIDPVSDPSLYSGTDLSSDIASLATMGKEVEGVSADGATRLLIRIDGAGIDGAELRLVGNAAAEIGSLMMRTGGTESSTLTLTPETTPNGQKVFFAIYRAPTVFLTADPPQGPNSTSRQVILQVLLRSGSQVSDASQPIKILRPPVLLVHGIWADSGVWSAFADLRPTNGDSKFFVRYSDYSSDQDLASAGSKVNEDLVNLINTFKGVKKIAALQADVVVHGMGAPIIQTLALRTNYLASPPTFNSGPIHKVTSIAGIHNGSGMASYLGDSSCVADFVARTIFTRLNWNQSIPVQGGALPDISPGSRALNRINSIGVQTPFPIHTIVGNASNTTSDALETYLNDHARAFCPDSYTFNFSDILGDGHDLFVDATSQQAFPVSSLATEQNSVPVIHSPPVTSPAAGAQQLNALAAVTTPQFGGTGELRDSGIVGTVAGLLDTTMPLKFARLFGTESACTDSPFSLQMSQRPITISPLDFSFVSTDTITNVVSAPNQPLEATKWQVQAKIGKLTALTPSTKSGPTFSFMPKVSMKSNERSERGNCQCEGPEQCNPGNGSCEKSPPLQYKVKATLCGESAMKVIFQDEKDIIRQEYINRSDTPPDKTVLLPKASSAHFTAAQLNHSKYGYGWGSPGTTADNVYEEYKRLINNNKEEQLKDPGTTLPPGFDPSEPIIKLNGGLRDAIDEYESGTYTTHCNKRFGSGVCTNVIRGDVIIVGDSGKVETEVVGKVGINSNSIIHIESGWRNPERNMAVGGVPTSAHMKGNALDLKPQDENGIPQPERMNAQLRWCILKTAANNVLHKLVQAEDGPDSRASCRTVLSTITHIHITGPE